YPQNNLTASFPAPPVGGVRATATVQTAPSQGVGGVSISSKGSGYTNSPNPTVTFSAPPSGGTQATGTVQTAATNGVTGVPDTTGTVPNGPCTAVVVAPPVGSGGVTATVSAARRNNGTVRFTVVNPGSGYTSAPTVVARCGPSANQLASAVATIGAVGRWITGIAITNPGAGYTSMPTVTINATTGSGFSGTATPTTTYRVASVTVTNPGAGYATPPVMSINGASGNTTAQYTVNTTANTVGGINQRWDGVGNAKAAASYFSPSYTPDAGSPLYAGATVTPYPNTASLANASVYPKFRNRTDCTGLVCTWADELQNYANWKTYHSTRMHMAKTGVGLAFQPLNPTFRLGWTTINNVASNDQLDAGVKRYTSSTQSDFLTWLYDRDVNGGTPNRSALNKVGTYYQRRDNNGPWGNSPNGNRALTSGSSDNGHAACRRSYAMLMTDGYYNDSFTMADQDSTVSSTWPPTISQPSSYRYAPIGPYSDSVGGTASANSFADVAMKYYLTDLRPDLANSVRSVPGDEAYWQHLNFYAIGLGVLGTLNYRDPNVLKELSGSATSTPPRTRSWPTPTSNDPKAIDDMWHATVNGRGKLLNAQTSDELNDAISKMMSDIGGKEGSQSGVAVSTASLTRDTKKYTPSYTPVTWNGNVTAYNLDSATANQTGVAWEVETLMTPDAAGNKVYQSLIPDDALRNIFVGTGTTSTPAVTFTYADMGSALRSQMTGTVNQNLIDYLRGDPTYEDVSGGTPNPAAVYRARLTRLGDIVNSTPVYVKDTISIDYKNLPTTVAATATWVAYKQLKQARPEGVIVVGANDGMLHIFRDGTYDSAGTPVNPGGIEVFGYVPNALLPTLSQLSDRAYVHRYYVDGPNTEFDAYLTGRGGWRNVVLGSTGAGNGGSGTPGVSSPKTAVYAIDTTQLHTSVNGMNASNVMWEVSSKDAVNFAELGYVLTDIQAGVTASGEWIAVFGNGYDSKSCQARLFVVNLETGVKRAEINTNYGNCLSQKNGLGGVRLVRNANQQIVGAYAGDLQGNMWKFDLSGSAGSWKVDLNGAALYAAGPTQPITAPPAYLPLPITGTTAPNPGYMVVFGTGKFYEVADITSTTQQSLYGIWDPVVNFGASAPAGTSVSGRSLLVPQTISAAQTGVDGNTYYAVSRNTVDYTATIPKRGWYIDMPNTGQRLVYPMDILADRFAVADTISPANVSLDPCNNEQGGAGFLYVIDMVSGGGPDEPILDTNGDNVVDGNDLVVSGYASRADGRNVTLSVEKNDEEQKFAEISAEAGAKIFKISCRLTGTCKASGTTVRRQWRQLFLR
ncbi:MAG: pilY1, partial [Ramlibacter sp.]|nr:pilY1 [Ramlibacter sp.]